MRRSGSRTGDTGQSPRPGDPEAIEHLQPRSLWYLQVQQSRVERFSLDETQRFSAVRCDDHVVPVFAEQARELVPQDRVVIGDQNLHRRPLEGAGR